MDKTSSLAVNYDGVSCAEADDEYSAWDNSLTEEHMRALEEFVTNHVSGCGPAKFVKDGISNGSYNRVVRFSWASGGSDVALKFPKPGHSAASLAAEKIANEAAWMEFFKEHTNIPVPHIYSYGTEPKKYLKPLKLPYILMDWVAGDNLREFLKNKPSDKLRSTVYQQLASFYLQLWHLPYEGIGSCTKDRATGRWSTRRPFTIDMHQLVIGVHDYPTNDWPTEMFKTSTDYFDYVKKQQLIQLWRLRNINAPCVHGKTDGHDYKPEEIARLRYEARYRFQQLFNSSHFYNPLDNGGPFRVFNPDFDTRNMTVDPTTGEIIGVFDLEFTNGMPSQFACDPPLSLFRVLPGECLDSGYFAWFLREYEPLLEEFLNAMRRVEEEEMETSAFRETLLSTPMRNSWTTKRVCFNYGITHTDHLDAIYWAVLHRQVYPDGVAPELPIKAKAEMEEYVKHTKRQLMKYDNAWANYFRKTKQ